MRWKVLEHDDNYYGLAGRYYHCDSRVDPEWGEFLKILPSKILP